MPDHQTASGNFIVPYIDCTCRAIEHGGLALPAAGVCWLLTAVFMLLPARGEWIVGGWDPGTYVVQGAWVSRTGTFQPAPDPLFSALHADELPVFVPQVLSFSEGMPVFPLDPRTRSFIPFFFRFMPTLTAVLDRCGGLRAATRANFWAGMLAAAMLLWFLSAVSRSRLWTGASLALTLLHPLWIYHLHFPTTELLQQALFFAAAATVATGHRTRSLTLRRLSAAFLFALLTLHLSMALFGALLLPALAWAEWEEDDRPAVIRIRLLQIAGIIGGVAFNLMTAAVTVERLGPILVPLLGLSALACGAALAVDLTGGRQPRLLRALLPYTGTLAVWGLLAAAVAATLLAWGGRPARFLVLRQGMLAIAPFLSLVLIAVAIPGLTLFRRELPLSRHGKAMLFVLLCATGMTLWQGAIVPIYPWATRRYLAFTVPVLAMLAAGSLELLGRAIRRPMLRRIVLTSALATLLLLPAGRLRRVWTLTEYDGLSEKLTAAAQRTEAGDVLIADRFRYGIPLLFIHGCTVLNGERLIELTGPGRIRQAAGILHRLHDEGWRIRFLTSTGAGMAVFPFRLNGIASDWKSEPFDLRELQHDVHIRDYVPILLERRFALHTWHPPQSGWLDDSPATSPVADVDIGTLEDAWHIVAGFHGREQTDAGAVNVRWTDGRGILALPHPPTGHGLEVSIDYIDRYRPPLAGDETVTLTLNGEPLAVVETALPHARRLTARIPAHRMAVIDHPRLAIHAPAWDPAAASRGGDQRQLGVMIDRLQVNPIDEGAP